MCQVLKYPLIKRGMQNVTEIVQKLENYLNVQNTTILPFLLNTELKFPKLKV